MAARSDHGLMHLLELDGETFHLDDGCWTKFEARKVNATPQIPHGIKYSLTLHDRHSRRLVGFDNAHAAPKAKKYAPRIVAWDHQHNREIVKPYHFVDAGKLLEDFWKLVEQVVSGE